MLTSGHIEISRRAPRTGDEPTEHQPDTDRASGRALRWLRLTAAVFGLLGALLALSVPLLPVIQDTTVITWPRAGHIAPVNAPLVTFQPQNLTATIPCVAATSLDARLTQPASLLSTTPPGSTEGAAVGMLLQVAEGKLTLVSRGQALGNILLSTVARTGEQCLIRITSSAKGTTAAAGPTRFVTVDQDVRPQVTGIYSALDEQQDPVDDRGQLRPGPGGDVHRAADDDRGDREPAGQPG